MAAVRAAFAWAVAGAALAMPLWAGLSVDRLLRSAVVFAAVWVVVAGVVFVFPTERFGEWAAKRVQEEGATPRLTNVAAALAIAIGVKEGRVAVVDADVPNVAAFPTRSGNVVAATSAAISSLDRDELEALVASQLVVAGDRWVRWASAAQLVQGPRFALLFGSAFLNPILVPLAFLAFFGGRYADGARDLVADAAAVRATRHPDPLVRALRRLGELARAGGRMHWRIPGFLIDQFWVVSTRSTTRTTVSGVGGTRTWTTADEVAAEMTVRADRVERAARGDWSAFTDIRAWRRALRTLGRADG
jgi:Zn-dependent protease with chaperone function